MRKVCFLFTLMAFLSSTTLQSANSDYVDVVKHLLSQFSAADRDLCSFSMDAPHRREWSRFPGDRKGIKLTKLNEEQKISFHAILRSFFPSQGYLKITSIMFNEDIQKKNEPVLGRNEYWLSIFGTVSKASRWGWKLEGHHLSINMTLEGEELISFTPITLATNPAIAKGDGPRDGLAILYNEEHMARSLIQSFSDAQLAIGYSDRKAPKAVYGEIHKTLQDIPDEGILIKSLDEMQQNLVQKLVSEYVQNIHASETPSIEEILSDDAKFFFIGSKEFGKPQYYRIENGRQFIEYENYNNHIHILWRNDEDFGASN